MANILLVDTDEVAQRAMIGIITRNDHRCATVDSVNDAWSFIQQNVVVDLLITELNLGEESSVRLIRQLKSDTYLRELPIIVYAKEGDRNAVKSVLELNVQNFLLKPYQEAAVCDEIKKGLKTSWRESPFAKESVICRKKDITPAQRRELLENLGAALSKMRPKLKESSQKQSSKPIIDIMKSISQLAADVGAIGVLKNLKKLYDMAMEAKWSDFTENLEAIDFAANLIRANLDESARVPEGFLSPEEKAEESEAQARQEWIDAPKDDRCPMVEWKTLQRQLEGLSNCPVIDSIGAAFQMSANGHPTSLSPLRDLIRQDPSLTTDLLIQSNRIKKKDDEENTADIEETRIAVNLMGERRLASLGENLITVQERLMKAEPNASWPRFRLFQLGTARLAQFVARYLEMVDLETAAYTAGLISDIGRLLLLYLHPHALQAIQKHAWKTKIPLAEAEVLYLETTTNEMGAHFGQTQGLPQRFVNVMLWRENPKLATEDQELVAIVALARDICRYNRLGFCGEKLHEDAKPLESVVAWEVLRQNVFLSFDFAKFERFAKAECEQVRSELLSQFAK